MPMEMQFSATVDGDSITGDAKLGHFGEGSFVCEREWLLIGKELVALLILSICASSQPKFL